MIKLAINFSYAAAELLSSGKIELDVFKTPPWPNLIEAARPYRPVRVHFNLNAGAGPYSLEKLDEVERFMEQTGTPFANLHLAPAISDFPQIPVDSPEGALTAPVQERMMADIVQLVERFGPERVIAENIPYHDKVSRHLGIAAQPEVISKMIRETGCGLLLDISHARISAQSLGIPEQEYLAALPVERIQELHFTGLAQHEGLWVDHFPARPEDWPPLEKVLDQIAVGAWGQPDLLAFEYGGVGEKFAWRTDPAVIEAQIPHLRTLLNRISTL